MPKLVAVTTDRRDLGPPPNPNGRVRPRKPEVWLGEAVVSRLRAVGLEPLLVPPHDGDAAAVAALVDALCDKVDGIVLTGGAFDIHPSLYGATVDARLDRVDAGRTALELLLARAAMDRDLPLLGICGGMQAMVVAAGGSLVQDIATCIDDALEHEQPTDPHEPWHPVLLTKGPLQDALGDGIHVNSTHHQAVDDPGELVISGRAPDGVVEVVHRPGRVFQVGVQWHPEGLDGDGVIGAFAAALR